MPARPTTDVLCGRARASLAHGGTGSCGLAPVQAQAQFSRLVGVKTKKTKRGRAQYTPHPNNKRDKLLWPAAHFFASRRAAVRFRRRISLPRGPRQRVTIVST
jgi:hypothetical protein